MHQVVMIYKDPLTRQQPEGVARLVRAVGKPAQGVQKYMVNFLDDGPDTTVERVVNLRDVPGSHAGDDQ